MRKASAPLQIRYVDPASLKLNEQNPRLMPPEEMAALKRSLAKWGFVDPIIVRRENGEVIGGHQRIAAAAELGIATVPVVDVDVSEIDALLLNVALNRIAGRWDEGKLALVTEGLRLEGADLSLTGFTEGELRLYLQPKPGLTDPDAMPEVPEPVSKTGDLWLCGDHRLLCGDATKAEDVERLMAGEKAELLWTDPPYGVGVGDKNKWLNSIARSNRVEENLANDTLDEPALVAMLGAAFDLAIPSCTAGAAWYVAAPAVPLHVLFGLALKERGIWRQTLQWVKNNATFAPMGVDYHWQAEPIFYGWLPNAAHRYRGGRQQTTVWNIDRPTKSPEHPTMKPVELVERAVANSSDPGHIVLDPFLGSGTTMIACERLGRRCHGMEIEPRYVDVAVKRWEQFTGREAQLEPISQPNAALARKRARPNLA